MFFENSFYGIMSDWFALEINGVGTRARPTLSTSSSTRGEVTYPVMIGAYGLVRGFDMSILSIFLFFCKFNYFIFLYFDLFQNSNCHYFYEF